MHFKINILLLIFHIDLSFLKLNFLDTSFVNEPFVISFSGLEFDLNNFTKFARAEYLLSSIKLYLKHVEQCL